MSKYIAAAFFFLAGAAHAATDGAIRWQPWSNAVFARAQREHRFVLMDLEAVWCHWCHVMNNVTYGSPKVIELIKKHYILVRVDQDARPDISRRYEVALRYPTNPGILQAGFELANDPVHITVVGRKSDAQAARLFAAALRYPSVYRRIEWWDKREGAMPNPDVQYPELPRSAAFACTNGTCSLPIFNADNVAHEVERALGLAVN